MLLGLTWNRENCSLTLIYKTQILGQLLLAPRAPGEPFSEADRRVLPDIAQQVGPVAHKLLQTYDPQLSLEQRVTAREEERRRLQRDLHDGLGPTLAGLTLKLDAARNLLKQDPDAADVLLLELRRQIQATIGDVRQLVYDLRPPALSQLGLISAIREYAATYQSLDRLLISIEVPESLPPLSAAVEVAAYRIAQEGLTNVATHAHARHCTIRLRCDSVLLLEICDDGLGLAPDSRAGVGLISMRERAAELGGNCVIESMPTGGTRVWTRLPLLDLTPDSNGQDKTQPRIGESF
jgi:signal transduction histidine kinase